MAKIFGHIGEASVERVAWYLWHTCTHQHLLNSSTEHTARIHATRRHEWSMYNRDFSAYYQVLIHSWVDRSTFRVQMLPRDSRYWILSVWRDSNPWSRGWESSALTTRPSSLSDKDTPSAPKKSVIIREVSFSESEHHMHSQYLLSKMYVLYTGVCVLSRECPLDREHCSKLSMYVWENCESICCLTVCTLWNYED